MTARSRPVGLHDHHADVVRDDVVQLAGDPRALGCGRDLRLGVPLGLEPGRTILERHIVSPPIAHRVAQHPGDQGRAGEHHRAGEQPLHRPQPVGRPGGDGDSRADQADGQGRDRLAPGPVGGHRVEQHQHGQVRPGGPGGQHDLAGAAQRGQRERQQRCPPPVGHRHDHQQRERDHRQRPAHDVAHHEQRQGGRQNAVHQNRMAAQPGIDGGHRFSVCAGLAFVIRLPGDSHQPPG